MILWLFLLFFVLDHSAVHPSFFTRFEGSLQIGQGRIELVWRFRCIRFLDATSHLYMRVCPSVRPSVRMSVRMSDRWHFSENAGNDDFSLRDASYYPPGLAIKTHEMDKAMIIPANSGVSRVSGCVRRF